MVSEADSKVEKKNRSLDKAVEKQGQVKQQYSNLTRKAESKLNATKAAAPVSEEAVGKPTWAPKDEASLADIPDHLMDAVIENLPVLNKIQKELKEKAIKKLDGKKQLAQVKSKDDEEDNEEEDSEKVELSQSDKEVLKKELKERAIKKLSPNTKSVQKSKDAQEAEKQQLDTEGNYDREQMVQEKAENMEHTEMEEQALEQMIRHDEEKTAQVTKDLSKSHLNEDKTAQEKMQLLIKKQEEEKKLQKILFLQTKFDDANVQVQEIVQNFEHNHDQLSALKLGYIQQILSNANKGQENSEDDQAAVQL